jgi:outer membrane protein OmpA-like peptidoglycan-associated protein
MLTMNYATGIFFSMCIAASLVACKEKTDLANMANQAAELAQTVAKKSEQVQQAQPATHEFDINQVPLSHVALGDFPYISLPSGYMSNGEPETKRFARFPFWVKGQAHWVEGRFYLVNVYPENEGEYSPYEVRKNLEAQVEQMGGVKVSEEQIPYDTVKSWGDEITMGFIKGLGDVYSTSVMANVYLVRRDDGNIWIHFAQGTTQGGIIVGQEKAFQQTAQLLPASEMKKQLDSAGKVALQVKFATDKTDILPDSQPQIEQVMQLLKDDPSLKLAINGHTDNSGEAAHNQTLSEGRAAAVVAALATKGVASTRLAAHGYGDSQPVADNATPEGKAKNRRVELVKQ